jgi:hypothetical protein
MDNQKTIDGLTERLGKLKEKRAELKKGMDAETQKKDPQLKRMKKALRRTFQKKARLVKGAPAAPETKSEGAAGGA